MKLIRIAIIAGLLITFIVTLVAYPSVPDRVVSHWNAAGEADGYMSKLWGLGLIPLIMTGFVALLAVLPRIDPYKKNYEKFGDYYEGFILLFVFFMLAIQVQIILWSSGYQISPNLTFPFLIGTLFIYIGFLLGHAEQNWFVGIRTPWTLSSETVWKKTHELGGNVIQDRRRHCVCRGIGRGSMRSGLSSCRHLQLVWSLWSILTSNTRRK